MCITNAHNSDSSLAVWRHLRTNENPLATQASYFATDRSVKDAQDPRGTAYICTEPLGV